MPEYDIALDIDDETGTDLSDLDSTASEMSAYPPHGKTDQISHRSVFRASTTSISADAPRQVFENGRRYCNAEYFLPDGDAEHNRLQILHQLYTHLQEGRSSYAYIPPSATRILDIGTGTGEWAISTAERFRNAECIATDISSSLCQLSKIPSNLFFELDDARLECTYSKPFDFIHMRGLAGALSDWKSLYANAFRLLTANGQLEVAELGPMINYRAAVTTAERPYTPTESRPPNNSYLNLFNAACLSAARKAGVTGFGLEHILDTSLLRAAGFSVVKSKTVDVPLGVSDHRYGVIKDRRQEGISKMALVAALEGLEAMSLRLLTQHLDWEAQDVKDLCEKVAEEVKDKRGEAFMRWCVVVVRRVQ